MFCSCLDLVLNEADGLRIETTAAKCSADSRRFLGLHPKDLRKVPTYNNFRATTVQIKMPKRKRGDDAPGKGDANLDLRARIDKHIFQAQRELQQAIKLAKGFERPKLHRRLQQAKKANDEVLAARISAEIDALKVRTSPTAMVRSASIG